jgi:hypothetical protein
MVSFTTRRIGNVDMKTLFIALSFLLVLPQGTRAQQPVTADPDAVLHLGFDAFDQTQGAGWRKLASDKRYVDAAHLLERYAKKHKGLTSNQQAILNFHAGQVYAFADNYPAALRHFRHSYGPKRPPNSPVRWYPYVRATIAFLRHDRRTLMQCRKEIAAGPEFQGSVPNLSVVDALIAHFGEPYSQAYGK